MGIENLGENSDKKPSIEQSAEKEKPEFLYHGSNVSDIEKLEPRKRYTPAGQDVPERVYAGDSPAFAAAHSFPWATNEGFRLSTDNGRVIFEVPAKFKNRLMQKVYLYRLPSDKFKLTTEEETGHTYHSQEVVKPSDVQKFDSVQDVIEYFGGIVSYIENQDDK